MKYCSILFLIMQFTDLSGQMDRNLLSSQIDSLVQIGLDSAAFPGCQVVVLHDGDVVFNKSFGYHTYAGKRLVEDHHLYDLASLTKVTTGLPLLMYLHGKGQFDIEATVGDYLPQFKRSNKADLTWKEVLSHQAGLVPWIPHWQQTLKKNKQTFKRSTFRKNQSNKYTIKVSKDLYLHRRYPKKMGKAILKSPLMKKEYKYSGILFYLMPELISDMMGKDFEVSLYDKIYNPIGASRLRYRPLAFFDIEEIVPTEYDSTFRKALVHGIVHDEGAAMMNGISCNAGLFGNATDLAKLGQLYTRYGLLSDRKILEPKTVKLFGSAPYSASGNRRGLGFDKPLLDLDESWIGPCGPSASANSFGHSGFTGTYMWVDPDRDLVFVFLSNRVHPTRSNRKLYSLNLRQLMHEACYQAIR